MHYKVFPKWSVFLDSKVTSLSTFMTVKGPCQGQCNFRITPLVATAGECSRKPDHHRHNIMTALRHVGHRYLSIDVGHPICATKHHCRLYPSQRSIHEHNIIDVQRNFGNHYPQPQVHQTCYRWVSVLLSHTHRLQLSLNLRDSPGFLATVPRPGRLYNNCIIGPGRGPDTSINTVVVVQLVTYLW